MTGVDRQRLARIEREADCLRVMAGDPDRDWTAADLVPGTGYSTALVRQTMCRLAGQGVVVARGAGHRDRWRLPATR